MGVREQPSFPSFPYSHFPSLVGSRRRFLPRHHRFPVGDRIDRPGDDRRGLLQVLDHQPLVGIHVGVMGADAVFQRVLNELESGHARRIKRQVIGPTGGMEPAGDEPHVAEGQRIWSKTRTAASLYWPHTPRSRPDPLSMLR